MECQWQRRAGTNHSTPRYLHNAESVEMHHPELAAEDLTPLLNALRAIDLDA
jgi:hypothetical protein